MFDCGELETFVLTALSHAVWVVNRPYRGTATRRAWPWAERRCLHPAPRCASFQIPSFLVITYASRSLRRA